MAKQWGIQWPLLR